MVTRYHLKNNEEEKMKTKYNRFAFIPFHCTECHRIIWLEPYRKADVWTNLPPCCPATIKKKICNECLNKYNVK